MRATSSRPAKRTHTAAVKALALIALVAAIISTSDRAHANPFFATKTGRPCASCHNAGEEMSGVRGLNNTGIAFLQAFRANPDRALRDYVAGSNNSGGSCTAKFSCGGDIAVCYFRTF